MFMYVCYRNRSCDVRVYNPSGLPIHGDGTDAHPKVPDSDGDCMLLESPSSRSVIVFVSRCKSLGSSLFGARDRSGSAPSSMAPSQVLTGYWF